MSQELRNGAPDAAERGVCIQKRPLTQFWHCHKVVVSGSPPPHLPGFSAEPPELGTCECNGLPQNPLPYLAILEIHPSTSPSTRLWDVRPIPSKGRNVPPPLAVVQDVSCRHVDSTADLLDIMLLLEHNLHRSLSFQVSFVDWEKGVSLGRDHGKGLEPSLK